MRWQNGGSKNWELLSAFYISFCCQALPPQANVTDTPSSSTPNQSPLSSPGGAGGILEENYRLRLEVNQYEALLREKSNQLCEKGEALVACQSTTVKHILDLAVALKEKLDQQVELDASKKTIDLYQRQVAEKEQQNGVLQQQLESCRPIHEQLEKCQQELQQVSAENQKLKEKVRLQGEEIAQQKAMTSRVSAG